MVHPFKQPSIYICATTRKHKQKGYLCCIALKWHSVPSEGPFPPTASTTIYLKVNLLFKKINIYFPVEAVLSECGGRQMASRLGAAWRGGSNPVGLRSDPFDGWSHLASDSERGVRAAAEIGAGASQLIHHSTCTKRTCITAEAIYK